MDGVEVRIGVSEHFRAVFEGKVAVLRETLVDLKRDNVDSLMSSQQ